MNKMICPTELRSEGEQSEVIIIKIIILEIKSMPGIGKEIWPT